MSPESARSEIGARTGVERRAPSSDSNAPPDMDRATELIGAVSHELRAPLHAMLGFGELLAGTHLSATQLSYVNAIRAEGETLRTMIEDLLDYSRAASGRLDLIEQPFSPTSLVSEVIALLRGSAVARNLTLNMHSTMQTTDLSRGDKQRTRQILVNLTTNAIKFTPFGSVTISVEDDRSAALVRFRIADTGIGIPPGHLDQIFEPFSQVRTTDQRHGTGLGLAISHQLAELMGGVISVESAVGAGSTFTLCLPLQPTRRAGDVGHIKRLSHATTASHILVVDDSALNLTLARGQLERLGHRATLAPDGETALARLEEGGIDLVLMDWRMPGIDGIETTRRFRAQETSDEPIPIIGVTANVLLGDRGRYLAAGMNDVLSKPVSIDALAEALATWLPESADAHRHDHTPMSPTDATLDASALVALTEQLGNPETVRAVVRTFLEELPGRRTDIAAAARSGHDRTTIRAAHTLKSASRLVGASRLSDLCEEMERAEPGDQRLPRLVQEIDEEAQLVEISVRTAATRI